MTRRKEEVVCLTPPFGQALTLGVRNYWVKPKTKMIKDSRWIPLEYETPEGAIENIKNAAKGLVEPMITKANDSSDDNDDEYYMAGWRPWTEEEETLFSRLIQEKKQAEKNRAKSFEDQERNQYERLKAKFEGV